MVNRKTSLVLLVLLVMLVLVPAQSVLADEPLELKYRLGVVPSPPGDYPRAMLLSTTTDFPSSVDLSGDLPPVGNQGAQGSCVGWATSYYYKTFQERQERGWDVSVPEHQLSPAFIYNQRSTSDCELDAGMSIGEAMNTIKTMGAASLAFFPYDWRDACTQPNQDVLDTAYEYRSDSFGVLFVGQGYADITAMKQHLASGDLFVIAVPVYTSFYYRSCADPVVPVPGPQERYYGGHAIAIVGYDDDIGGFKFVNSWGPGWGCDGYAYLSYDLVQQYAWEAWVMTDHVAPVKRVLSAPWCPQ